MARFAAVALQILALMLGLAVSAAAQVSERATVLAFIRPADAGPQIPLAIDSQPTWVVWPTASSGKGLNRIQSIISGLDWDGDNPDFLVSMRPGGHSWVTNHRAMSQRGMGIAVGRTLGPVPPRLVQSESGAIAPEVYAAAYHPSGPDITSVPPTGPFLPGILHITRLHKWEDIEGLQRAGAGRILVVEYPPPADRSWSHFWLLGAGWPDGVPVAAGSEHPGLFPARELGSLLAQPVAMAWVPATSSGPLPWLQFFESGAVPIVAGWLLAIFAIYGLAMWSLMTERRSEAASFLFRLAFLSPAAWLMSAGLAQNLGPSWTIPVFGLALGVSFGLAGLLQLLLEKADVRCHPLFTTAVSGAILSTAFDPAFSIFGSLKAISDGALPGYALGCFLSYWVATVAFCPVAPDFASWSVRGALGFVLGFGLLQNAWWEAFPNAAIALPIFALIAGERWIGTSRLAKVGTLLAVLWLMGIQVVRTGFTFLPDNLQVEIWDRYSLNFWSVVMFLISPVFLSTALFGILVWVFGNKFLARQLTRAGKDSPPLRAFTLAAWLSLAFVLPNPNCLPVLLVLLLAGFGVRLHHAVREL